MVLQQYIIRILFFFHLKLSGRSVDLNAVEGHVKSRVRRTQDWAAADLGHPGWRGQRRAVL